MTKLPLYCLLLLFLFLRTSSGAPQDSVEDIRLDNSEPSVGNEDCLCVPYYQCRNGTIVQDGTEIMDKRVYKLKASLENLRVSRSAKEEKYNSPECDPFHDCCRFPDTFTVKPYKHRCGFRNPGGINTHGRILTTNKKGEAEFGEWPWQVAVLKKDSADFLFMCGGTLIDNQHVLTVAQCADKFKNDSTNAVARLGEWDTQNEDEFLPHEDYNVAEIITHPDYWRNKLHNDIAILKLSKTVEFRPHIDTACLPQDDDDFTGQDCIVTGWGTDTYKSNVYSMIMKEVVVPVIGHRECQEMLRNTRLGRFLKLHDRFMCAGGMEGEDACKGDGGGPLVCYKKDKSYRLAGLVSWGIDCGRPGLPGVYVDVRKYTDWISSKTGRPLEEYWPNSDN